MPAEDAASCFALSVASAAAAHGAAPMGVATGEGGATASAPPRPGGGEQAAAAAGPGATGGEEDIRAYGQSLGMDVLQDEDLLWLVQEAFHAPLPPSWTEHTDVEGRVYFFHGVSNQSSWEHPMDAVYRELIGLVRQARQEVPTASEEQKALRIHRHLREVHQRALRGLEAWSGPYASAEGDYYHSEALQVSTWDCPVTEWEKELVIRHTVLCRCLLGESLVVGADGSVVTVGVAGAFPGGGGGCPGVLMGPELLQVLQLPLGLVRREAVAGDAPATPSTSRSFHTARSITNSSRSRTSARSAAARASSPARTPSPGAASRAVPGLPANSQEDEDEEDDEEDGFDFTFSATMDAGRVLQQKKPNDCAAHAG